MNYCRYLLLLLLSLSIGCSVDSRPADLPPLFPCTVSVTQGGAPLDDANVELVSTSPDTQKYRPSATTDANGIAVIMTYGFPGAPAGTYKILVRKMIEDDIVYGTDEYGEQRVASSSRYQVVGDRYFNAEATPHEIEVTPRGRTQITIDVGEPVRVRVRE